MAVRGACVEGAEGRTTGKFRAWRSAFRQAAKVAAMGRNVQVRRLHYRQLSRPDKGVVMDYLARTTGYSRAQLKHLVRRVTARETLSKHYMAPAQGFARKFTAQDVALLAETDALHGTLLGPATRCLMQRAVELFGDTRYERLASISVAHLYNLRRVQGYETRRRHWTKTPGLQKKCPDRQAPRAVP